eukprot:gene2449-2241_t
MARVCALAALALPADAVLRVFLMSGQSNMEGQAFYERKNSTTGKYLNGTFGWLATDPRTRGEFAKTIAADGSWAARSDVW